MPEELKWYVVISTILILASAGLSALVPQDADGSLGDSGGIILVGWIILSFCWGVSAMWRSILRSYD